MKKTFAYSILSLLIFGVVGCSDFVSGYDESPNSPTEVTPALLLSSAELGLQTSYTSGIDRVSSVLIQQLAGTMDVPLEVANYNILEGDNVNEWNTLYNNVIQTSNDLINTAGDKNPYYLGIAKTLKAMGLAMATDVWGDVPATEAGTAITTGNTTPKFDSQESIYEYIQTLLAEAKADFSAASSDNVIVPGKDDFFYSGNIAKWSNAVTWLQARYYNHLSKKDATGSASKVLSTLGNSVSSVLDKGDLMAQYGTASNEINQWYAYQNARANYIKVGENLVNMLTSRNDPRKSFYVAVNSDSLYVGSPVDNANLAASNIGVYVASKTSPIPMVTYDEALFIQAEAALRANPAQPDLAAKSYNAAVVAAITRVTGDTVSTDYVKHNASETASTITLQKIMEQKYLALYVNIEAWTDWRRTGFPVLTANPNGKVSGIPRRLPTVIDERKYNPNAIVVSNILTPVWWDE